MLKTARTLGVSYKRLTGWVPSDGDTVEWDETETTWMLALQLYETAITCPLCGLPTEVCHDEQTVNSMFTGADVEICFATQLREKAMRAYTASGIVEDHHCQTTRLNPRI